MTNLLSKYTKKFAIIASILMLTMIAVPMVAAEYEYKYDYCDETYECDITQILPTHSDDKCVEFYQAIKIAERFLHVNPDGMLILKMSEEAR